MVKRREKLLRKLGELRALQVALAPFALKAAKRSGVALHDCPPLTGNNSLYVSDIEHLGRYLSVSIEIARLERKLARSVDEVTA